MRWLKRPNRYFLSHPSNIAIFFAKPEQVVLRPFQDDEYFSTHHLAPPATIGFVQNVPHNRLDTICFTIREIVSVDMTFQR
ncbi:hypothetical protein OU790_04310 [Ruegeria sp. NA]|nr:hypothetical protein [Ruegeria sp. NA]MCX8952652.1 hypothetical protein [Ruegeria sp. NA]